MTNFRRITEGVSNRAGKRAHIVWQPEQSLPLCFSLKLQAVRKCNVTTSHFNGPIKCGKKESPTSFLPEWSVRKYVDLSLCYPVQSSPHTHTHTLQCSVVRQYLAAVGTDNGSPPNLRLISVLGFSLWFRRQHNGCGWQGGSAVSRKACWACPDEWIFEM